MAGRHAVSTECSECGATFTVASTSVEPIQYCPFCGDTITLAYDDLDDESLLEDDLDDDELEPELDDTSDDE